MPSPKLQIGLVLFPNLTRLDLTGPAEVFGRLPGTQVHLLWKDLDPVSADRGMRVLPTTRYDECPPTLCDLRSRRGGSDRTDERPADPGLSKADGEDVPTNYLGLYGVTGFRSSGLA